MRLQKTLTESEHGDETEHDETNGITGLVSILKVSVTLDGEKTTLELIEDEETPGLYFGMNTPTKVGHPLVHVFGTINEDAIEVTFHPEAKRMYMQLQYRSKTMALNQKVLFALKT